MGERLSLAFKYLAEGMLRINHTFELNSNTNMIGPHMFYTFSGLCVSRGINELKSSKHF